MDIDEKPNDLLLLAAKILTIIAQIALGFAFLVLALVLPLMFVFQGDINAGIATEFGGAVGPFPIWPIAAIFLLLLGFVALTFIFFAKLRAIVNTVGQGDPFAPVNADRLNLMGWLTLANQALLIPLGGLALIVANWAEAAEDINFSIDAGLEVQGVLLAIILFILARVFKHGARMRDDLEGTV